MRSSRPAAVALRRLARATAARGARLRAAARDFLIGCAGLDDYARYLTHQRCHYAEQAPLSRDAFFRRELVVRWDGVRRCC